LNCSAKLKKYNIHVYGIFFKIKLDKIKKSSSTAKKGRGAAETKKSSGHQ
jgi:hypothetical protein